MNILADIRQFKKSSKIIMKARNNYTNFAAQILNIVE
jgi:hypothetical protein